MNTSIVQFEGPLGLASRTPPLLFEQAVSAKCGIYLWAIPYRKGGYLVSYVGETGVSFWQRTKEHLIQTMGGNYRISDPELLVEGEAKTVWNGLWRRDTRDRMLEYLERAEELAPLARRELQLTVVFVAPLEVDARIRQRIEAGIALEIRKRKESALTLLPDDIRYRPRRESEQLIRVEVRCPAHVHGLPTSVDV